MVINLNQFNNENLKKTSNFQVIKFINNQHKPITDTIAIEQPLEIFLDGQPFFKTMRTPGEDGFLILGYCYSENILESASDISKLYYSPKNSYNQLFIELNKEIGIKNNSLSMENQQIAKVRLIHKDFFQILSKLKENQKFFEQTGCTHATVIFDKNLVVMASAEDVGRYNALDKAIGKIIFNNLQEKVAVAITTSRLSYEMVQKVKRIGIRVLIGISPPTSLAIDSAKECNMTLVGFLRENSFNIYTNSKRIVSL